jgi:hypothetical protein
VTDTDFTILTAKLVILLIRNFNFLYRSREVEGKKFCTKSFVDDTCETFIGPSYVGYSKCLKQFAVNSICVLFQMQPVMGVAPVVPQMNGTLGQVPVTAPPAYGFFQSFPQAQVHKSVTVYFWS